ncbi:MAG TPA: Uma2 family endonuclease [Pyrinomonadaceae bacterium]
MTDKPLSGTPKYRTPDDYLMAERQSGGKNEFLNGRVVARSGSNRWHNLIVSNIAVAVGSRIHAAKTDLYLGNMRVKLRNNFICYPDVVIVNGEPAFADQNADLLLNPTVVVEIISSATNTSDKTQKLENYLALDSIRECVLIKEDEMRIEQYTKQNSKQWIYKICNERDDVLTLDSVGCKVSLSEIYAQIKFQHAPLSSSAVN